MLSASLLLFRLCWTLAISERCQSLPLKNSPTAWGWYQHTLLLGWYSAGDESSRFPSNMMLRIEVYQIRESCFSDWGSIRCFFQVCFLLSSLRRGLSLATPPFSPDLWSVAVMFVLLHIWSLSSTRVIIRFFITILTKVLLHQLLSLARRPALRRILVVSNFFHLRVTETTCFWVTSMKQNVFSELFPRCVAWRNPVSELYRHFFWPQGLVFALICIISCWTFY